MSSSGSARRPGSAAAAEAARGMPTLAAEAAREAAAKAELKSLEAKGFPAPEGERAYSYLDRNLDLLGSLDPELRDGLFYEAAGAWLERYPFSREELQALAERLVSGDFLFRDIEDPSGDEVYRRTFSALVLDLLVRRSNGGEGMEAVDLGAEATAAVVAAMERYAAEERNLSGYDPGKGWAHSIAHAADVLASLAASPYVDRRGLERVLAAARTLLLKSQSAYAHQECGRIAKVLVAAYRRGDPARALVRPWIEEALEACPRAFADSAAYARWTNLLDLLRSLYFHLRAEPDGAELADFVESKVRVMMRIA